MSSSTKEALGAALKKMMAVKPIDKITVKDLVEICGVNRQTFYYHFDNVYDLMGRAFEYEFIKKVSFDEHLPWNQCMKLLLLRGLHISGSKSAKRSL